MTSPTAGRRCDWCRVAPAAATGRFCSKGCRQTAWRLRRRGLTPSLAVGDAARFAYADPPYPGLAKRHYGDEPTYAGEVDHAALIASLEARRRRGELLGWALSTSRRTLRDLLPLCPQEAEVCPWVKPIGVPRNGVGRQNRWEAVIVVGGRATPPGIRDWLRAMPARGGGDLMGRKPIAFCAWLFDLMGMRPGDVLEDLFPGTGVVARAWMEQGRVRDPPATPEDA